MSDDPLLNAPPVTLAAALAAVEAWRADPDMVLWGLHQIAIALDTAYQKERAEHRLSLGAGRNLVAQHQKRAARVDRELKASKAEIIRQAAEIRGIQHAIHLIATREETQVDRIADAALGCSEGMACRRPVWFGCCATRKRICAVLGVEFQVERPEEIDILRESGYVHPLVVDPANPRAPRFSGGAVKTDNFKPAGSSVIDDVPGEGG